METLSVKYICKLSALVVLLCIGFIYKVPVNVAERNVAPVENYTRVAVPEEENVHQIQQLYPLVVPNTPKTVLVTL